MKRILITIFSFLILGSIVYAAVPGTPVTVPSAAGNGWYLVSTTSGAYIATTSDPAHFGSIFGTSTATSTLNGPLQATRFQFGGTATSTGTNGWNISAGCFSVNNVCTGTGGSGTVTSITAGTGLTGGTITTSGTISLTTPVTVLNGGTGGTTWGQGWFGVNDSGAFLSSTSPTVNYIVATSTVTASQFPYASTTMISATTASSSNYYGGMLTNCNSASNALTWNNGVFGCNTISGGSGASYDWLQQSNVYSVNSLTPTTTIPIQIKSTSTSTFAGPVESWNNFAAPYLSATSSTATSTFKGGATFGTGGGNFGIGLTTPIATLDVTGNVHTTYNSNPILGPTLILNGNPFVSGLTSWTDSGSNWTFSSGHAKHNTGATDTLSQTFTDNVGQNYYVTYHIFTPGSAGTSLTATVGGVTISTSPLANTFSGTFVGTGSDTITFTPSSDFNRAVGTVIISAVNNNVASANFGGVEIRGDTSNTFFGNGAGVQTYDASPNGNSNVAVGVNALSTNITGNQNVAVGLAAGINITSGIADTILGYNAGLSAVTGKNNVVIGQNADIVGDTNNMLSIGNLIYATGMDSTGAGNVGIANSGPNWKLSVTGTKPSIDLFDSSAGSNLKHWLFSSMGGFLYIGTTTDAFATSTPAALTITNSGNVQLGYKNQLLFNSRNTNSFGGMYVGVDTVNTASDATYIIPPPGSNRVFIGDASHPAYSLNFSNVSNFESMPVQWSSNGGNDGYVINGSRTGLSIIDAGTTGDIVLVAGTTGGGGSPNGNITCSEVQINGFARECNFMSWAADGDTSPTPNAAYQFNTNSTISTLEHTLWRNNGVLEMDLTSGGKLSANYFNATSTTASQFPYASTTMISATTASTSVLIDSGVVSALHLANSIGQVTAYGGTTCTNQFVRSLSALGAATCNSVANTDLTNSSLTVTAGTGLSGGGSVALGSSVTLNLATPVTVANGGTGATSWTQGWFGVNDSGAFLSSTSPTVNYITATSTTATSTFRWAIQTNSIQSISTTATSSFGDGINLANGCFAINGTCLSNGGGGPTGTGFAGMLTSWTSSSVLTATSGPTAGWYVATSTNASTFVGSIGIGTTSPYGLLSINPTTSLNTGTPAFVIGSSTATEFSVTPYNTSNSDVFDVATSTTAATGTAMIILTNGNVGIGSTSPWRTLDVNGTVGFKGLTTSSGLQTAVLCLSANNEVISDSVACLASSDRYKMNINPLTNGLDEVMALKPVDFYYTPEYNGSFQTNPNYNGEQVGFIAEQAAKVDPRLVITDGTTNADPGKVAGFRYENFTAILTSAIQQVWTSIQGILIDITGLRKQVNEQQAEIDSLNARLKAAGI